MHRRLSHGEKMEETIDESYKEPLKVLVEKNWPCAVWIIAIAEVAEVIVLVLT